MGFTAGMIGTNVVAIYICYEFIPDPVFLWATDANGVLAPFLIILFLGMTVLGRIVDPECFRRFRCLVQMSGQAPSDFSQKFGEDTLLVKSGLLGLLSTGYELAWASERGENRRYLVGCGVRCGYECTCPCAGHP